MLRQIQAAVFSILPLSTHNALCPHHNFFFQNNRAPVFYNPRMRAASLFLLSLFALTAHVQSQSVAITIDDLPCISCAPINPDGTSDHGAIRMTTNQRLTAALAAAHIPVTGFVITNGTDDPNSNGYQSLQLWLNAGFDLGSHTNTHANLSNITVEQEESEIDRADAILRPMLAAHHKQLQFFRYPYLDTGDTRAKHDTIATYLKAHGYQNATCTIDGSDYEFAPAYARAIGAHNAALAKRIRDEYLTYSATEIDFYASLNREVLGYEPPQVLLIHDSLLNADSINDLLDLFRKRGYSFVTLTQAQSDPVYATPDTYISKFGPMWGYRWEAERNFHINLHETEPPDWIVNYSAGKPLVEP
jgi:peptidoglycan/xylan/chitin deacetylase (PgdA/CDA1 family)